MCERSSCILIRSFGGNSFINKPALASCSSSKDILNLAVHLVVQARYRREEIRMEDLTVCSELCRVTGIETNF